MHGIVIHGIVIHGIVMTLAGVVIALLGIVVLGAVNIRLARQAVIFALLGQLLATVWIFVTGDRVNRDIAQWKSARAVHGEIYYYDRDHPLVRSNVLLSDGTRLVVRFCAPDKYLVKDCREDSEYVERDYWAAYKADRDRRSRSGLLVSLVVGLKGFPWGLGLWGFYRIIYFAMKG